jgi:stress response protein SCP2
VTPVSSDPLSPVVAWLDALAAAQPEFGPLLQATVEEVGLLPAADESGRLYSISHDRFWWAHGYSTAAAKGLAERRKIDATLAVIAARERVDELTMVHKHAESDFWSDVADWVEAVGAAKVVPDPQPSWLVGARTGREHQASPRPAPVEPQRAPESAGPAATGREMSSWLSGPAAGAAVAATIDTAGDDSSDAGRVISAGEAVDLPVGIADATLTVSVECTTPPNVEVELVAVVLDVRRRVGGDPDFVFFNQPVHPSGAVQLEPAATTENGRSRAAITVRIGQLPTDRTTVAIAISADDGTGHTASRGPVWARAQVSVPGGEGYQLVLPTGTELPASSLIEIYLRDRPDGTARWRLRAVQQGWADGIVGLAREYGMQRKPEVNADAVRALAIVENSKNNQQSNGRMTAMTNSLGAYSDVARDDIGIQVEADATEDASRPRDDLSLIISQADPIVQRLILGPCREVLDLVHAYLPANETISALLPTRANITAEVTSSLLVLTERRVILVAPAPQAVSWPLVSITKFQFVPNSATHVNSGDGQFMLGADPDMTAAGKRFADLVKHAVVKAVLCLE